MTEARNVLRQELEARTEERLHLALRAGEFGIWDWDIATGEVSWSDEIYRIYRLDPSEFHPTLDGFVELVHPDDREAIRSAISRAVEENAGYHVVFRALAKDGERWLETWGETVKDGNDRPIGMIGLVTDATDRVKAEEERAELLRREREARAEAEAGRQRMAFLNQAFKVLGTSLDLSTTTDRVLNLLVPHLGDWAVVHLYRDGRIEPLGWRHRDPEAQDVMAELIASFEVTLDTPGGAGEVIRTGNPILEAKLPEDLLDEVGVTQSQRTQLAQVGIGSYMVLPMASEGRTIGSLSVGVGVSARPYSAGDLDLAEQIAHRAGLALHNARLFEERTSVAKVLQRSLLPAAFPKIKGCELAGGYRSAGTGLDVGGDFYDVFQIDAKRFGVAIGDVSGKGHEAAAVTALTRHTIRATAMLREDPADVLAAVNGVLLDQTVESRFCTAAFGVLEPADDGQIHVRVARAGHPPPLVARASGLVEAYETDGALLGMFNEIELASEEFTLERGDVLVLYTDGLTDVNLGDGVLGEEWLRSELAVARKTTAAEIARALERNVANQGLTLTDDIAILVVKVSE